MMATTTTIRRTDNHDDCHFNSCDEVLASTSIMGRLDGLSNGTLSFFISLMLHHFPYSQIDRMKTFNITNFRMRQNVCSI